MCFAVLSACVYVCFANKVAVKVNTASFQDFCQKGCETLHEAQGLPSTNPEYHQASTLAAHAAGAPWGQHTRQLQGHRGLCLQMPLLLAEATTRDVRGTNLFKTAMILWFIIL